MDNVINLQAKNNIVNINHAAIEQHQGDALALAVEAGEYLLGIRVGCKYGEWQPTLNANGITVPAPICDEYMKAADGFSRDKTVRSIDAAAALGRVPPLIKKPTPDATRKRKARAEQKAQKTRYSYINLLAEEGVIVNAKSGQGSQDFKKWAAQARPQLSLTDASQEADLRAAITQYKAQHMPAAKLAEQARTAKQELPKSAQQKLEAAKRKLTASMEAAFREHVAKMQAEMQQQHDKKLAEHFKRFDQRAAEIREAEQRLDQRAAGLQEWITLREYRLIRSCLHPDREASPERKAKAFHAFGKLEDAINLQTMQLVEERRRTGWYGWLNRDKK